VDKSRRVKARKNRGQAQRRGGANKKGGNGIAQNASAL